MKIGDRMIGLEHPPLVIAEIGINHGGSFDVAKAMVTLAARSGAECVKHQTHFVDDEMTEEARQIIPPNSNISIWEIIERSALSQDDEVALKLHAESLGLIYLSTPFSRKAADFLNDIGILAFKIGSGEADNLPLVRHIASFGKPIIMSTGMHTVYSIRPSVEILRAAGLEFALLECTNLYPSPPEIVSLQGINELRREYPDAVVGFSDHSIGPEMSIASVALGACVLERHFTDDRYRIGPDISCSMDPAELRHLVDRSREIYVALRNPKVRSVPEEAVYSFARASIVADRDLPAGHLIGESDIWARRPGDGEIPGYDFDKVVGKRLNKALTRNTQITWMDLD